MKNNLQWKLIVVLLVFLGCCFYLYPSVRFYMLTPQQKEAMEPQALRELQSKAIALGLDLQGGMHLALQVQTDEAVTAELLRSKNEIAELLKKNKDIALPVDQVSISGTDIVVTVPNSQIGDQARKLIVAEVGEFNFQTKIVSEGQQQLIASFKDTHIRDIREKTLEQTLETIRNRVDEFGVSEPIIQRQGLVGSRILIQLPGISDIERAKGIIGRTAQLKFHMVRDSAPTKEELLAAFDNKVPDGFLIMKGKAPGKQTQWFYLLERDAPVTGSDLEAAYVGSDEYGLPAVDFQFKRDGANKFHRLTSKNIGRELAIVLDGEVQSAPRIQSAISKRGQITGNFNAEEAQDLSLVLRAGALPASVVYLEERVVGPSLGKDSVRQGIISGLFGTIIVLMFMIFYYRLSGVVANIALLVNILILIAAMAGLRATLTLPGIAGIILTIGMAVDANILIYERIREEIKLGKTVRTSIQAGFSRATLVIVDANITTIIAGFILLHFGTGPVRGFAVTLSIGIVATLFASLVVSRLIFDGIQQRFPIKQIKYLEVFHHVNIDFMGKRNWCFIFSGAVIGAGLISIALHGGLKYGIDFTGGTLVQLKFTQPVQIQDVRNSLDKVNMGGAIIQKYGAEDEVLIRTMSQATDFNQFLESLWKNLAVKDYRAQYTVEVQESRRMMITARDEVMYQKLQDTIKNLKFTDVTSTFDGLSATVNFVEISKEISDALKTNMTGNTFEIRKVEMVGPVVGKEMRQAALYAVILSWIGILIYVAFRFEISYAVGSVLALVHDTLVTIGLFSLTNKEFSMPVIAAILTIIGYSINDTIVVFDRIRENVKLMRGKGLIEIMNVSINQTLSRTILTSMTVLFTVVCLFFWGGEVIHDFSFALIVGVVFGTYSSIYIASPLVIIWNQLAEKRIARIRGLKKKK